MPDFDKNLQTIIQGPNIEPMQEIDVRAPKEVPPMDVGRSIIPAPSLAKGERSVFDELKEASAKSDFTPKGVYVTNEELRAHQEYDAYNPEKGGFYNKTISFQSWGFILIIILIIGAVLFIRRSKNENFMKEIKNSENNTTESFTPQISVNTDRVISELERIQQLRNDGVLSEVEFENLKKSIFT